MGNVRKGITPVIAIIILLLIAVAIAGAAYTYIISYYGGITRGAVEITGTSCNADQAVIFVKNIGTAPLMTSSDGATGAPGQPYTGGEAETRLLVQFDHNGYDNGFFNEVSTLGSYQAFFPNGTISDGETVLLMHMDEGIVSFPATGDESSYANHGTLSGGVDFNIASPCQSGSCLIFSGGIVTVADEPELDPQTDEFTIEAWIQILPISDCSVDANKPIINKFVQIQQQGWAFGVRRQPNPSTECGLQFLYFADDASLKSHPAATSGVGLVPIDTWTYVAVVYDDVNTNTVKLYIEDQEVGSYPIGSWDIVPHPTRSLILGKLGDGPADPLFNGVMDELAYHTRALSYDELMSNRAAGHVRFSEITDVSGNFKWGSALSQNTPSGIDQHVVFSTHSTIELNGDITLEAFIKPEEMDPGVVYPIIDKWSSSQGYTLRIDDQALSARFGGKAVRDDDFTLPVDQYYHVAAVWESGGNIRLYYNGQELHSDSGLPFPAGTAPLYIGRNQGGTQHFKGYIDEVRISNTPVVFTDPGGGYSCPETSPGVYVCDSGVQITKTLGTPNTQGYVKFMDNEVNPGQLTQLIDPFCDQTCKYKIATGGRVIDTMVYC
jgi:flagellin-like protein